MAVYLALFTLVYLLQLVGSIPLSPETSLGCRFNGGTLFYSMLFLCGSFRRISTPKILYLATANSPITRSNNLAGSYKRSAGMAIHIGAGNLAGAMASNFYRAADKPKYILGHALEIGFVSAGLIAVLVLRWNYARINARRDREGNEKGHSMKEMSELGDRAPTFRYML
jgi:hypothetical protein